MALERKDDNLKINFGYEAEDLAGIAMHCQAYVRGL